MSLAYSKEHNSIVERANKEVMRHLTAIIFDKRVNSAWSSEYLPLVQRIMNAKVHDTISVSPAKLLFGKAINLYTELLSPFPPESLVKGQEEAEGGRLSDHVAKLIKEDPCCGGPSSLLPDRLAPVARLLTCPFNYDSALRP